MKTCFNAIAMAVLSVCAARAADYTWSGSPADALWNLSSPNWNAGEAWVDGNNAVFPATSSQKSIIIPAGRTAADVTVDGAGYTFGGAGTLSVSGKFTANFNCRVDCGFAGESVRLGGVQNSVVTLTGSGAASAQSATILEDGPIFAVYKDSCFGPVPASPSDNVVISSGTPGLFLDWIQELAANRTIRIESGAGLRLGNARGATTPTVVRSLIAGRPDASLGFVTNAAVSLWNSGWGWNVHVSFDPGAGRTNDIGRLDVATRLSISGGATRVASFGDYKTGASAPLYVHGNGNSYADGFGNLVVDGGVLLAPQSRRYADIIAYGQVTVTNGGVVSMPGVEWLHGDWSPARLSVSGGGEFHVGILRLSQTDKGTEVTLGEGGLLSAEHLSLCPPVYGYACRFLFDGGRIQSRTGRSDFFRSTTSTALTEADWANVAFVVGEKGAVLDSTNGNDIWWSRPLASGTERDGGVLVTATGTSHGTFFMATNAYHGATVVRNAKLQACVDDALPAGSTLRLEGGNVQASTSGSPARDTVQRLGRVEGTGAILCGTAVSVSGSVAPDAGGTLDLAHCALSGDYEIRGNASECGCIAVAADQDVSGLALKAADMTSMDMAANGSFYKILDAPDGYTGRFALPKDFPSDAWRVRYTGTAAYLAPIQPTVFILR